MNWLFTILDRNNVTTVIEEPTGFDSVEIELKRDKDTHGIFFDYQGNDFQFTGEAMRLIKAEYEAYGIDGNLVLIIEQSCSGELEELYRGRLLFSRYEFNCGDECYVKIPIETTGDVMQLRNKWDQKVDLQTLLAFDETTVLPAYDKLPFNLELPSKGVFIQDHAVAENEIEESFNGGLFNAFLPPAAVQRNLTHGQIELALDIRASEIGGFNFNSVQKVDAKYYGHTMDLTRQNGDDGAGGTAGSGITFIDDSTVNGNPAPFPYPGIYPLNLSPTVNLSKGSLNFGQVSYPAELSLSITGIINVLNTRVELAAVYLMRLPERLNVYDNGEILAHYEILYREVLSTPVDPPGSVPISAAFTDNNFTLNDGDRLYLFISLTERKTQAQVDAVNGGAKAFTLFISQNSFFKLTDLSKTPNTISKVFAVNESISRIAEAITNDNIRAYSEYFGRTESQPYSHASDGCGGLEAITKGLFIRRQENRIPNKPAPISLSMRDIFEGLDPIHHIGFGIEEDTNRPGFNRLRVEPWKYFYSNSVLIQCDNVNKIDRAVVDNEYYSTFNFGYQKWEAEEFTGLDEFLTRRKYRTTLSSTKNELNKLSLFIASGYAWELTRRRGSEDSKDWRFDNDTFIICCKKIPNDTREVCFLDPAGPGYNWISIPPENVRSPFFFVGNVLTITGSVNGNDGDYTILEVLYNPLNDAWFARVDNSYTIACEVVTISSVGIAVELGNVINALNIIDPPTIYNYRISPIRNAMRWIDEIFQSYRQIDSNAKIIFMDGDANVFAEGEMESAFCKWENQVMAENETIDITKFQTPADAMPILRPERINFEYPLSLQEFKAIKANPYGLIDFNNHCEAGSGWIDNIKYRPEEGIASFTLIPQII